MKKPNGVVMGGGTGTFAVTAALKILGWNISCVIAVSDSGGSTGKIRDEFGFQPVGDLRQSLAALADPKEQTWIQKILLYRFERGNGLKGHNLGNLILTALQDMTKDTTRSLRIAERVFNLRGSVIPVTQKNVDLLIHYSDGSTVRGEHILDHTAPTDKVVESVSLNPCCDLNPVAREAIINADYIFIGPGDFYASLMATLVVDDIPQVFAQTSAKIVYISNLMTRRTQTHGLTASGHLSGIESAIQRPVDHVFLSSDNIPENILKYYSHAEEYPIIDDLGENPKVHRAILVNEKMAKISNSDVSYRSLLRHDPKKLSKLITKCLK